MSATAARPGSAGAGGPRWVRWVTACLIAIELVAWGAGRISGQLAIALFVAIEAGLAAVILMSAFRSGRRNAAQGTVAAVTAGLDAVLPRPAAAVIVGELRMMRSLWLLAMGRLDRFAPTDDTVPYAKGRWGMQGLLGFAAGAELLAVDLLVPWESLGSWGWLRWLMLGLSGYGLIWVTAWAAAERTHPHLATDQGLVLRTGPWVAATISWTNLASVSPRPRWRKDETRLTLDAPMTGTNLDLETVEPVTRRSAFGRDRGRYLGVSLSVDDPTAAAEVLIRRCRDGVR